MSIRIVSAILLTTLILLISEKIQVDLTAIGIMVVLMVTVILTPAEAVPGFANPAVITVGAMFLIGRRMIRTGVVGFLVGRVVFHSGDLAFLALRRYSVGRGVLKSIRESDFC